LRNLAHCPVELNLIPETTRRWQTFNEKKPYLIFTVFSLVAVVGAMGLLFQKLADVKDQELVNQVLPGLEPRRQKAEEFQRAYSQRNTALAQLDQVTSWMEDRYYWANVCGELRRIFIRTEDMTQNKLKTDTGVWIEQFLTMNPRVDATPGRPGARFMADPASAAPLPGSSRNQVSTITLVCRAVNLQSVVSDANTTIIYTLESQLKASPLFDEKGTQLQGSIYVDDTTGTFTFGVVVALKHPLKL
jgi:hypothetical protein